MYKEEEGVNFIYNMYMYVCMYQCFKVGNIGEKDLDQKGSIGFEWRCFLFYRFVLVMWNVL